MPDRISGVSSFLRDLSLAIGLLTSDQSPVPDADGFRGYTWRVPAIEHCQPIVSGKSCVAVQSRWDWKRDQRYELAFRIEPKNRLVVSLALDNRDPTDKDSVCAVALFTDADDNEIAVFYQNWYSLPGRAYRREVPLLPARDVTKIAKLAVGTRQCDPKAAADAKNFYRMRTALGQR